MNKNEGTKEMMNLVEIKEKNLDQIDGAALEVTLKMGFDNRKNLETNNNNSKERIQDQDGKVFQEQILLLLRSKLISEAACIQKEVDLCLIC